MSFYESIDRACELNGSMVCVGLDPVLEKLPDHLVKIPGSILEFNKAIIDSTKDSVCAYKPNAAFYEQYGIGGIKVLHETISYIHKVAPEVVVILDAKRGDIGNTSKAYAKAAFEDMDADAITLAPYMGSDSLGPFFEYYDKGCIVLCRTSNPGGADLQNLETGGIPFYEVVAKKCAEWNTNNNICLVVGATVPEELKRVREIVGDEMPFLVPGIGAQGGDPKAVIDNGRGNGKNNLMVNSSRGILYASAGEDFADAARQKAIELKDKLNSLL